MSNEDGGNGPQRTVFRPSPLQNLRGTGKTHAPFGPPPPPSYPDPNAGLPAPPAPPSWGAAESNYAAAPASGFSATSDFYSQPPEHGLQQRSSFGPDPTQDDVPPPATPAKQRNPMMAAASPFLALVANVRTGRARITLPELHARAVRELTVFDNAIKTAGYPDDQRRRAQYAVCATIDDVAQNLPGQNGAEWARRSMVIHFFGENIGGDRFWQLLEDMLKTPATYKDLIELFHGCMAVGFEGRFRVIEEGRRRHYEVMQKAYAALEHVRDLSDVELSPHWRGQPTPARPPSFWAPLALAVGAAALFLLLAWFAFSLVLGQTGQPSLVATRGISPDQGLRMSRSAPPPPAVSSAQVDRVRTFLAPEIQAGTVTVDNEGTNLRVRTTVGNLFDSGSDVLRAEYDGLFGRIGQAIDGEPGPVRIEGHADSDRIATLEFPDNQALSAARATRAADRIRSMLKDPSRVTSQGFGDAQPIASNDTAEGKAQNRRVEILLPRSE